MPNMNTIALEIGEKILNDINIAFDNDDSIDELGFVMDKEPSIICIEHKLGMTLGSLKPLFIYCSYKLNELMKIGISSLLDDNNNNDSNNHDNYNDILLLLSHITRGLLLVRGDYPPAFAYRKKMITLGVLSINTELNFLKMLFAQHPKSPSSWQHRRWCLMTKDEMIVLSSDDIEVELSLCTASAESYPKNYYAWMHRLWLLQYMKYDHLMKELGFCDVWLLAHVSDHSAVSHKHQVLKRVLELITTSDDKLTMLFNTLTKNENSLLLRPGNEALWYDRRGIMLLLLNEGSQLNPKRWKLLYTKRMPQYINDFNNCQEFRINECVDSDNYKTNIDDINNIVLETWAKDNINNYCDVYHKTAINTKVVLETLIHLLSTSSSNDDTLLDNFMILLIQSEVLLCRHCSIDGNILLLSSSYYYYLY